MDTQNNVAVKIPPPSLPPPGAINILHRGNGYVLDDSAFQQILLHPKYADKKLCIVSIVGMYNTGKSYLLNFFLKYLEWLEKPVRERSTDWLENDGRNLDGFEWQTTTTHTTQGIKIWSKPFLIKNDKNDEIVVLLIDTEGYQYKGSNNKDAAVIYVLATMLSSIQIYNIHQKINDNCLQHLWLGVEYQKLIFEQYFNQKPFPNLLFLIRYWSCPYRHEYGVDGGKKVLEMIFQQSKEEKNRLRNTLLKTVSEAYEKMSCFLMPHPGAEALEQKKYRQEVIEKEFLISLQKLLSTLFDPENIVVKKVDSHEVTCREFYEHFKKNIKPVFQQDLPGPKTWLSVLVEAELKSAKAYYITKMEAFYGHCSPLIFEKQHKIIYTEATELFKKKRQLGGKQFDAYYLKKLENEISEEYKAMSRQNTEIYKRQGLNFNKIFYWIRENLCQCIS